MATTTMTTTMKTTTMKTTPGTILLPPTPPQTPPLEAKKSTIPTFHSPLPAPYGTRTEYFEKPPQQPPKASTLNLLSPALPIPASPSTTFAFEKAPPASQPSQSLLAASARLSALGWKSRSRQGPQGDCRLLQKPNHSLAIPTLLPGGVPSVIVHGPKCECRIREEKTEKVGDDELVARVSTLARKAVVRERVEEVRMLKERERRRREKRERSTGRRKKGVFGWRVEIPREVSRFFGSGSTTSLSDSDSDSNSETTTSRTSGDNHKITDLCLACSNLDIDKIFAHFFTNSNTATNTNQVPVPINGRCTITSSESENAQPVETTPLFSALRSPLFATRPKSQVAILGLLLDLGADANASVSLPPLSFASIDLSNQAQQGRITALSTACILGNPQIVALLLQHGAKVDAKETSLPLSVSGKWGKGLSALDVAILAGQETIVEVLLRSGAKVTGSCEVFLPVQVPTKLAGTIGGRPRMRMRSASTANFHSESRKQQLQQQYQGLGYGLGAQEPQWRAPLPVSRKTTRLSGVTPLHLACMSLSGQGHLGIASMILSSPYSKADTNARTSDGRTSLHYAAESLHLEVTSLLLSDHRTETDATDDDGATPLALLVGRLERIGASSRTGEEVVELVRRLLRAGANAGVRYTTDLSLKARLLVIDDGQGQDKKWGTLFDEDGRGVMRGSMKRRTF